MHAAQPDVPFPGLGKRIQRLRERVESATGQAMPARELARLANISETYPSMLEKGIRLKPAAYVVTGIADVFATSADYLLLGKGNPPSDEELKGAVEKARAEAARKPSRRAGRGN